VSRKSLRTLLQLLLFTVLGAGVIWYMFSQMSEDQRRQMVDSIQHLRLIYLGPFILVTIVAHWARARRWQLLLHPLGIRPTTANTLFSVLIGYIVNLVPPRAGEVAKCTVLARYEKVPPDKMVGTIVAERAWDVVCLIVIIVAGLAWQASVMEVDTRAKLMHYLPHGQSLLFTAGILIGLVATMVIIYRTKPTSRISRFIHGLADGVSSIWRLREHWAFLIYTLVIWGGYIAQIMLGFWALPGTENLGMGAAVLTLVFGSVGMIAAPGGLGLYPFLTALILTTGYGVPEGQATAFGWVSWGLLTGIIIVMGILSLILLPLYNRTPHNAQAPVDTVQDTRPGNP
jgi:hypothetical protein